MKHTLLILLSAALSVCQMWAQESPDVFSQTYGEKWVRLVSPAYPGYAARSNGDAMPANAAIDVTSEAFLWCLVGNATGYKLYNRAMGDGVALTADGTGNGDNAYFTSAATAKTWHLIDTYAQDATAAGYVIAPVGTTATGINAYGGATGPLRFWTASGGGTHWQLERMGDGIAVTYRYTGQNPFPENNTRVAYLDVIYGQATAHKSLTTESDGQTDIYYLPLGQTVTFAENVRYRGYEMESVDSDGEGNMTVNFHADPENKYQYLWYSNSPDGHPYRIPAIAKALDGTLVAVSDYRPCNNDIGYGEVDLVMRRSMDNGKTWTAPQTIADGNGVRGTMGCGFGDAALVADRESSRLLLICVGGSVVYVSSTRNNSNNVCRLYSEDNGQTWSAPEDITQDIYGLFDADESGPVNGLFFGSGRIFQSRIVKKGDYYRLYAALCARPGGNRVVYSDDFGLTWQPLGGVNAHPVPGGDEPKCEELPNGNVVISSRKSGGRYFNVFKFDDDDYTTGSWGNVLQSNQQEAGISMGGNSCNGEILIVYGKRADGMYPNNVYPIALQSLPWGSGRSNVGIWWKPLSFNTTYNYTTELFSRNWNQGLEVSDRGSAYSTMCVQADNRIGFFYEEEPNNYCMVYIPLTLEEITLGQYRMYDPATDGVSPVSIGEEYRGETLYDLSGRRVEKPSRPGLYLQGGRKVLLR